MDSSPSRCPGDQRANTTRVGALRDVVNVVYDSLGHSMGARDAQGRLHSLPPAIRR